MKVNNIFNILLYLLATIMLLVTTLSWAQGQITGPREAALENQQEDPQQIVRELQESLLNAMREGEQLSFQQRFDLLEPAINQSHDLDLIVRTALGSYWVDLDDTQRSVISDTFRQLSIATYAGRFKQYSDEQFEILQQRELPRGQLLIRSQFTKSDKSTVDFDYVLQQGNDGWKIANIIVDGVSDLALKRTEYRAILQRDGFSALVEMLIEKIHLADQD